MNYTKLVVFVLVVDGLLVIEEVIEPYSGSDMIGGDGESNDGSKK